MRFGTLALAVRFADWFDVRGVVVIAGSSETRSNHMSKPFVVRSW
jgi:hypothetical protein